MNHLNKIHGHRLRYSKKAKTVLVVDDFIELLKITEINLNSHGYIVITAKNGLDALNLLQAMPELPFALITDWNMPLLNGEQLIRGLVSAQIHVNHVIISSSMLIEEPQIQELKSLRHGLRIQHIQKPYAADRLIQLLEIP